MHARKLVSGLVTATVALSAVALTAGPASAAYTQDPDDTTFTPVSGDLIGVGSDTTQHAMKLLADAWNAKDAGFKVATYAATPTSPAGQTIVLPNGETPRPNGSGAGKQRLYGANNNAEVDFARSSSAQDPATETDNGLKSFAFAVDEVVTVTATTTYAPPSLTVAQLIDIYNGTADDWGDVGGVAGQPIQAKIPQDGSGTRKFFLDTLKANNGNVAVNPSGAGVVQEHDPAAVAGNPNAIAPFSFGRNNILPNPQRVQPGFSAKRALYNAVRGTAVNDAKIQAIFGESGFLCSTEARPLIEEAGFQQLATPEFGGKCGSPETAPVTNFTLNERVVTTTTLTVTSTQPGKATLKAQVTGASAPQGTVTFYKNDAPVATNVPLTSGQATAVVNAAPGPQTYTAAFTPAEGSIFEASEDEGTGVVKTSSKITETFPATVKQGKKAKGTVVVTLAGVPTKATGKVTVKEGAKTLASKLLSGGKVSITLPKFAKNGKHKLTVSWGGSSTVLGSSATFTIKQLKKKKKKK